MDSNEWTSIFKALSPGTLVWKGPVEGKKVYITFDDGPTGPFTLEILDMLDDFQAKATFFCVGGNVMKNPDIYQEILKRGHRTGNHTFHHVKGWKTYWKKYLADTYLARNFIDSDLFRPPYGKISYRQVHHLKKEFRIIMWSLLSLDFDQDYSAEQCLEIVNSRTTPGDIVVFHDNKKAEEKVRYALPKYLEKLHAEGYEFATL